LATAFVVTLITFSTILFGELVPKRIGQLFPGPSKTTRAYQLREDGIVAAAAAAGFSPVHRELNQAPFYFSRLVCFERA
jgi:magnesium-protoporphyrin O-methyltransferase